jgi:hypothetical protein
MIIGTKSSLKIYRELGLVNTQVLKLVCLPPLCNITLQMHTGSLHPLTVMHLIYVKVIETLIEPHLGLSTISCWEEQLW